MATSKTLAPTNVTIQIPEFTDQPDQRVNSNCIDKEADAINALNAQIAKLAYKADVRMSAGQSKTIAFSNYVNTALLFSATSGADGCLYVFSNGYLLPVKTSTYIAFSLGADYKTITVTNNSSTNIDVGCISTLSDITVS